MCIQGFGRETLRKTGDLESLGIGGKFKMDPKKVESGKGGVDWINLAHDTDKWGGLVSAVMNLRVPCSMGNLFGLK
jgi:hypothetical protein